MEQLYTKIKALPNTFKQKSNDFIDFLNSKKKKPKLGCAKGQICMSPDFDEPIEDF